MSNVTLGRKEFDPNCEEIRAWSCGVSNAQAAVLWQRMAIGEFRSVKKLFFVRVSAVIVFVGR